MKQHNLFYEIDHKRETYFAYHLGLMESPKHFIHLYNLDTRNKDGGVHTISYNSIEKLINKDEELTRKYLKWITKNKGIAILAGNGLLAGFAAVEFNSPMLLFLFALSLTCLLALLEDE